MLQGKRVSPGGRIPPCHGFRIQAEPGGSLAAVTCNIGRGRDVLGSILAIPNGTWFDFGEKAGPFWVVVDPDSTSGATSWLATWSEEEGFRVGPGWGPSDTIAPSGSGAALRVAKKGVVLYDSGSVAGGALIDSGVLNLTGIESLQVFVDNTAGAVFRDLSLLSYLDDGTTLVDTAVIRRCGYGAAPTGSNHAPGAVRGTVGPCAANGANRAFIIYDATSGDNATLDSGLLWVEDCESFEAHAAGSAGTTQLAPFRVRDDGTTTAMGTTAATLQQVYAVARGYTAAALGDATATISQNRGWVGRRARFTTTAAGAGNTVRLVVTGYGRTPGTFAHQMALPTRAKLQLAAAGAANARMTIFGR